MKLTDEQLGMIQQWLASIVKYRETYDEVYDHVVLTIENNEEAFSYAMCDQVVEQEFGGAEHLKLLEKDRAINVNKALRKKHWQNMMLFFNWPTIMFTIAITIAGYFIALNPVSRKYMVVLVFASALTPMLILGYKKLMAKYRGWFHHDYQKQSIKEGYIFIAASLSCNLFNCVNFLNREYPLYGATTLFAFVFYTIYVLSFFKLYRDTFSIEIAK